MRTLLNLPYLTDLFNQNFRKTASSEVFCNVAIGTRTHPKPVHPNADFVVIVNEQDLANIPAPFLSRFSKFILNMDSFLKLKVDKIFDPVEKEATVLALPKVRVTLLFAQLQRRVLLHCSGVLHCTVQHCDPC
jgi:hypothetical protein